MTEACNGGKSGRSCGRARDETPMVIRFSFRHHPTLLALLVLALVVTALIVRSCIERPKVIAAYERLYLACEAERWDEAYGMMTSDYRARISLEEFREDCGGSMLGADATDWIFLNRCDVWGESGWLTVGHIWTFEKEDGVWRCDGHGSEWYVD